MRIGDLARLINGRVQGDPDRDIRRVAALESAGPEDLAYAEGARAVARAAGSRAGCILVPEGTWLPGKTTLAVAHPKEAFVHAAEALRPQVPVTAGVHPTAIVAAGAEIAPDAALGAYAVIERGAKVGARTRLGPGVHIGEGARVGTDCLLYPRVTIYPGSTIGNRVILHAGVVVGSDGFGYVFSEGRHVKFPQLGAVIIEDEVEIGSNSTVDRGSLGTTVIGRGTKIDNLVQIAHNVRIGRHCVIAAQTGISGSVEVGDYVVMGGQVGIGDHARIEDHVVIGGQAGVLPGKVIRKGITLWGTPARPLAECKEMYALWSNLPALARKVKGLSRRATGRSS